MGYFDPEIETLSRVQLRELQDQRLRSLVQSVYNRVPFYRRAWQDKGIDPKQISGVEDLARLPFTKKSDLRDHYPFGLFAVPPGQVLRLHCSSGTTGKPIVVGYTRRDIGIFAEVVARSLAAAGCQPGMKLQNAYGYGLFTGGLGLHYGAELLGMTVIPVSGGGTERQLMLFAGLSAGGDLLHAFLCTDHCGGNPPPRHRSGEARAPLRDPWSGALDGKCPQDH